MEGPALIQEITVLLLSGHALSRYGLRAALQSQPGITVIAESDCPVAGSAAVADRSLNVAVLDTAHAGRQACCTTKALLEMRPDLAVLIVANEICACTPTVLEAGARGVILKQVEPPELAAAIRSAVAGYVIVPHSVIRRLCAQRCRPGSTCNPAKLESLSARELEVLRWIVTGDSNAQIARRLHIGEGTVKSHIQHVLSKLCLPNRLHAVIYAYEAGLVDSPPWSVQAATSGESRPHPAAQELILRVLA